MYDCMLACVRDSYLYFSYNICAPQFTSSIASQKPRFRTCNTLHSIFLSCLSSTLFLPLLSLSSVHTLAPSFCLRCYCRHYAYIQLFASRRLSIKMKSMGHRFSATCDIPAWRSTYLLFFYVVGIFVVSIVKLYTAFKLSQPFAWGFYLNNRTYILPEQFSEHFRNTHTHIGYK